MHTNLPVNSDHYEMLQEANEAVARIMTLARSLGGVISGEHGIGITKYEFLTMQSWPIFMLTNSVSTRKAVSIAAN